MRGRIRFLIVAAIAALLLSIGVAYFVVVSQNPGHVAGAPTDYGPIA
jgi:hypothetical protein